jgi:L-alanine-DL-glutamate epimerase-like enolase superfamily enzyme
MKIKNVQALHVRIEDPNIGLFDGSYDTCVIVISTDEGITGIGEVESLPPAIQGILYAAPAHNHARGLRELLIGEDPRDPERLWSLMYEATDYVGRRGLMMHAIGGIDIALWDIAGQAAGRPVHALLGGARRDRVLAYGTIYPMARTPDGVRRQIADARAMNLRAFKLCADPWWLDDLALTATLLKTARREAGDDARIIIDAALSYRTVEQGMRLMPIYRDAGIWFLEAPLPLDDLAGHRAMSGHGLPLGVGDLGLTHVDEFIDFMDRGGADICQPDITMVGGFTGLARIARAARERGKRVITHGYKTNIEIAANLHFLANHPDEEILEWSTSRSPIRWNTTLERLPVEADGKVAVPQRPGLGVRLDWDFVMAHRWNAGSRPG